VDSRVHHPSSAGGGLGFRVTKEMTNVHSYHAREAIGEVYIESDRIQIYIFRKPSLLPGGKWIVRVKREIRRLL
jgi:hypothetical protein